MASTGRLDDLPEPAFHERERFKNVTEALDDGY